jgi:hypothetical protein
MRTHLDVALAANERIFIVPQPHLAAAAVFTDLRHKGSHDGQD